MSFGPCSSMKDDEEKLSFFKDKLSHAEEKLV